MVGVGASTTTPPAVAFLWAGLLGLSLLTGGNCLMEEIEESKSRSMIDIERILQIVDNNNKKMTAHFHEWKNKTERLVDALLVKEAEWKERTDDLMNTLYEKERQWKNRTEDFINTLLEKDASWKNGTKQLVDILQPKETTCNNVTESLVTTILDKESEWVTRSETLIQDTDNLKKLVRGLLFREAEAKKKLVALTTMVRNLLTFSGVARCEAPFKVVPYVGCIFLDKVGATWEEGRARCNLPGS
ncbi:uncharacterized protein [Macrobrachium rosenbergii]|uniref:uncharacterized protein n=1 Tax=Macrobrachium rosenbergii TaxID=79674 RepID=UPI0034D6A575